MTEVSHLLFWSLAIEGICPLTPYSARICVAFTCSLIDAIGTSLIRLDIFLILKIGLLNIDSPPVALRKIAGDWGLFAGMPRCVTEGALCFPSDKRMGVGS